MKMKILYSLMLLISVFVISSCGKNDPEGKEAEDLKFPPKGTISPPSWLIGSWWWGTLPSSGKAPHYIISRDNILIHKGGTETNEYDDLKTLQEAPEGYFVIRIRDSHKKDLVYSIYVDRYDRETGKSEWTTEHQFTWKNADRLEIYRLNGNNGGTNTLAR